MTFKGMLKILVSDLKKQHEEKLFSITNELIQTRRQLREVQEQLRTLQLNATSPPDPAPTLSLFVQYHRFCNELCDIRQTMTIEELLNELRRIAGISIEQPIRIRVLSDDGLTTLFFLDKQLDRTLESYGEKLKAGMILSIEDDRTTDLQGPSSERRQSYESDV